MIHVLQNTTVLIVNIEHEILILHTVRPFANPENTEDLVSEYESR